MKENYEYIQLAILTLFFLVVGPLAPLCFVGLMLITLHCICTQLYMVSVEGPGKPSEKLKISHYLTLTLSYLCAVAQFGLELFNVI